MRAVLATAASLLAVPFALAPFEAVAQPQFGPAELTRAKTLLDLSRAELSAEQFTLLSGKLAEAESAYAELTTAVEGTEAAVAAAEGGAAAAEVTATGGRALLGGVAELLPLLIIVLPSTAHAPGMKQEPPKVQAARTKLEEKLKELAQAASKVESERKAAAPAKAQPKKKDCVCICGDPKGPITKRKRIGWMPEYRCRAACASEHDFPYGQYECK